MDWLEKIWTWLADTKNREILAFIGGGLVVLIGALWKALGALGRWLLTRRHPLPSDAPSGSTSLNIIASRDSITTGGNITTTASDSGIAIGISTAPITITQTLSELDNIPEKQKEQLLAVYEDQVRQAPEKAKYHLALGLHYLDLGFYSQASSALLKAHQRNPLDPNALYYLALAECQGRRPDNLRLSQVEVIERYLRAAVANSMPKAHYLYFWAQVKYDYYQIKSLKVPLPSVDELIERAESAEISKNELRHLLKHVPAPSSPITKIILGKI
jgi:tetratricopeptide (TPR) repeat protein